MFFLHASPSLPKILIGLVIENRVCRKGIGNCRVHNVCILAMMQVGFLMEQNGGMEACHFSLQPVRLLKEINVSSRIIKVIRYL